MSIFKKLARLLTPPTVQDEWVYWIYVKCNRCGEKIRARVNLRNDLSIEYGASDADTTYFCRKTLIGEKSCYQPIEVELTFDHRHKLADKKVIGGQFIEEEEYFKIVYN
jgi:hypothetical protein